MGDIIFYGFILIILYVILIMVYIFPKESLLLFARWEYKNEPTFSDFRIRLNKYLSLFGILLVTIFIIDWFVDIAAVRMLLTLGLIICVVITILKLFGSEKSP